jgi:DNA-binding SARP family transcriptional activator
VTETGLRITVLGPLEVRLAGRLIGPGASQRKPRMLLAALAINANRVMSKHALIHRLWEQPPSTAPNIIEKYVSTWRHAFADDRLETVGHGYRLTLTSAELDLLEVKQLLADGRAALKSGQPVLAATAFDQAMRRWDVAFDDEVAVALPLGDAERLIEMRLGNLEDWAQASLSIGDGSPRLLELLSASTRRHPLRERLVEYLMWTLAQQGRHAEAAQCFETVRRKLVEELGKDPGEPLKRMHVRVLRQDPGLGDVWTRIGKVQNLPPFNPRFVGRAEDLDRLTALMEKPDTSSTLRIVAVWGLVGVGKSALALEYAHRKHEQYNCIWWLDATSTASTAAGLEELAARLGLALPADRKPSLYHLWDELRRFSRTLLIYDNAATVEELADHLPPHGTSDIIITSLNPEWRSIAHTLPIDVLLPGDAIEMLRDRIGISDPTVEAALATSLGRLPLAMGQAAAYIDQTGMSAEEYLPLFRRRRAQLLERGIPDDHRRTIDTTWRLAQAELSGGHPAAIQLVAMCSLLAPENIPVDLIRADPDLLPVELAAAVCDELDFEDVIRQVRRFSLMARNHDRLTMHCLVQTVISNSLTFAERRELRRVAAALLTAHAPTSIDAESWPRWETLVPHIRVIGAECREAGHADAAFIDVMRRASGYLSYRAEFSGALELMRDVRALIEITAPTTDDVSVGRALAELATALEQCGRLREAIEAHEAALAILRRTSGADDAWVARALSGLTSVLTCHSGVTLWKPDELQEAQSRFESTLCTLTAVWGEWDPHVARTLAGLGQILQDRGDYQGGRQCLERAVEIMESVYGPDHPDVGHCYDKLGYVLALCGEADRSRQCFERSAAILTEAYGPDHLWVAWSHSNRAVLLDSVGELEEALQAQERAHEIFSAGPADGIALQISAWRLARIHASCGRWEQAIDLLTPALHRACEVLGEDHADVVGMRTDLELLTAPGRRQPAGPASISWPARTG